MYIVQAARREIMKWYDKMSLLNGLIEILKKQNL